MTTPITKTAAQVLASHFLKEMDETHALGLRLRGVLPEGEFREAGQLLGAVICAIGEKGLQPLLDLYPDLAPPVDSHPWGSKSA